MSLIQRVTALAQAVAADVKALGTDPRLSDSREWSADTVTQAEAEAGTASARRAWTAQRVRQAINARLFADASGILTETSGALSNDMSSYLSSKTYAEMQAKLGVVPVTVVQTTGTSTEDVMSQKAVTELIGDVESVLIAINGEPTP